MGEDDAEATSRGMEVRQDLFALKSQQHLTLGVVDRLPSGEILEEVAA